jgi:acetyl-CoA C-acetyltransferase
MLASGGAQVALRGETDFMAPIYIVSGTRTAIGAFGGSLKDITTGQLGALVVGEALRRAGIDKEDVGHVVMGNVMPTGPKDQFLARVAALEAGIPPKVPALTVNRLCGSGAQSIISCAQMMMLGECSITVAGGAESMSRVPYHVPAARFGQKMGNVSMIDALTVGLQDPIGDYHMGITAENVAREHEITREMQDELAVQSHVRAAHAQTQGYFKEQIVPVEVKDRKGTRLFDTDEYVRTDVTTEGLAALKAVFQKDGTVTAGNASGINDGAAAVVLATEEEVQKRGLKPMAKIVSWSHSGVRPEVMGIAPVEAVPVALERAGLTLDQIDNIEANEAFAAQACAVAKKLGLDPAKTNVNGSGISLGHPVGATGTILVVKTIYELQRTGGRYGLVTMCIGGGQGIAMVLERC